MRSVIGHTPGERFSTTVRERRRPTIDAMIARRRSGARTSANATAEGFRIDNGQGDPPPPPPDLPRPAVVRR